MSSVFIRQYTILAGLVLLVYDQIITWGTEVDRIWCGCGWVMKMMFFLGRYGALTIQIINLAATHPYNLEKQVMSCHKWFGFQATAIGLLLTNLQLTSMLRVYALYERSSTIACFLVFWFLSYMAILALTGSKFVHVLKLDASCMMVETGDPMTTISWSLMCMLDQCILWGLTTYKYRDAIRRGWSTNPILRLVMRDTSLSCFAVCCVFIATLPYSLIAQEFGHIAYSLLCPLASVMTCRTILNMRGLWNSGGSSNFDVATIPDLDLTDLTQPE